MVTKWSGERSCSKLKRIELNQKGAECNAPRKVESDVFKELKSQLLMILSIKNPEKVALASVKIFEVC